MFMRLGAMQIPTPISQAAHSSRIAQKVSWAGGPNRAGNGGRFALPLLHKYYKAKVQNDCPSKSRFLC